MKFTNGDRIVAYDYRNNRLEALRGLVTFVFDDGSLEFTSDDGPIYISHPKQCRKLVKSKPRRRVFVHEPALEVIRLRGSMTTMVSSTKIVPEDREFIEVKRRGAK